MPEKLLLEGTPIALLLVFGESFRAAMDVAIVRKDLEISNILINITDARRGDHIVFSGVRVIWGVLNEYTSAPGSHYRDDS